MQLSSSNWKTYAQSYHETLHPTALPELHLPPPHRRLPQSRESSVNQKSDLITPLASHQTQNKQRAPFQKVLPFTTLLASKLNGKGTCSYSLLYPQGPSGSHSILMNEFCSNSEGVEEH